MKNLQHQREHGVALVVTMIVMAVLAVVAVAFMQSATSDRAASNSLVGNYQAMLAAEAGSECAAKLIANLLAQGDGTDAGAPGVDRKGYDDSVTAWQNIGGDKTNEATVLYIRAKGNDTSQGALPGDFNVRILARPLVSGLPTVPAENIGLALPFNTDDEQLMTEMVNLNATNRFYPDPWIGYRSTTNEGAPVTAARWIYIGRHVGPTNSTNPPIARYAYWIEDESFKLNLNIATNGQRNDTLGTGPRQLTMDGTLGVSGMLSEYQGRTGTLLDDRNKLGSSGFPDSGTAAFSLGLKGTMDLAEFRFLTTVQSAGLNLSRGGFKRFNINSVTNGLAGISQSDDAERIRTNLSRVIAAITNSNSVPNFGQRFYRKSPGSDVNSTNVVTPQHADIYLQKIAANMLDYADSDNQPTIVNNDPTFTLRTGRPTNAVYAVGNNTDGPNSIAAMGVENLPRLQEYAMHARLRSMRHDPADEDSFGFNSTNDIPNPASAEYEIWIDHYFEFWNPGTRDITLTNAFLQIDKVPAFTGVAAGDALSKERSITNVPFTATFPAGQVTVVTTAPLLEANPLLLGTSVVYLSVPDADRKFTGTTTATTNLSKPFSGYDTAFMVQMSPGPQTKGALFLGNDSGLLESFVGLPINARQSESVIGLELCVSNSEIQSGLSSLAAGNDLNARGGSLRGNLIYDESGNVSIPPPGTSSAEGDPRSLNEQLELRNFATSSDDVDQTRFYVAITGARDLPDYSTLGKPNANFVNSSIWVDVSSLNAGAVNAPLVVRNTGLQSSGELGHITDPARVRGTNGPSPDVVYARGGGRTLRVGQSEWPSLYDGNQTNPSRTWTSWRLADIFGVSNALSVPGLINPNGVLRDGGAALRSALYGLRYLPSPEGALGLASTELSRSDIDGLVDTVVSRLKDSAKGGLPPNSLNVFWERGELSELPVFNSGDIPVNNMSNVFDRGREELVRRSIEMVTTRGSVFTVYVLAQALQATPLATNVVGTARIKTTFEMSPQFAEGYDNDNFTVSTSQEANRFLPPTNYIYRILSSSHE